MTRAICPACRADIALDAALCARCGLAVRPTCANCGEALGSTDRACARCGEPIVQMAGATAMRMPAHGAAPPPIHADAVVTEEEEVVERTASPTKKRSVLVHLLAIALIAGVLVAGGLLALELFAPRSSAPFDFIHQSVPAYAFSLSRPSSWTESFRRVGGNPAVVFTERDSSRGFQVVLERRTIAEVRTTVRNEIRKPPRGVEPISSGNVVVDEQSAVRYKLIKDGEYRQQWWVERPGGVYRIDFWAPEWNQRSTDELAEHVIESFKIG